MAIADEVHRQGALGYSSWSALDQDTHTRMARLIGADGGEDVALLRNTSDALSVVARGLDWQAGQNVVFLNAEFPSNRYPWESLREFGVEARAAALDLADPEAGLLAAMDEHTRLVAVSAVQYASGVRMDLPRLAAACRERGALFCVDAIQQVGALPFDVHAADADFVALGAHKWLLGPEGVGVLWVRPGLRERLRLHTFGWHMAEDLGNFDAAGWAPATSARRFEPGTTNLLGIAALNASLRLFEDVGMDAIADALTANVNYLAEALSAIPGISLVTPSSPARRAGIVTFRAERVAAPDIHAHLVANDVVCVPRAGGVRFSPHFYTSRGVLDRALGHVEDALNRFR